MPPVGGPLQVMLILLSGVFAAGVVIHLFRARTADARGLHWFLATLCLLTTAFLLLDALEYTGSGGVAGIAILRRCEAAVASIFMIIYPWFLIRVMRQDHRTMPLILSLGGLVLGVEGVHSPTGVWLKTIEGIRPARLPWGEVIHQAYGQISPWVLYTLALWSVLTIYGIFCALRYRRQPGSVGSAAIIVFHGFFFVALINDMLMDAGHITSIPLAILCAPILVGGLWWRTAVEESRRSSALRELFRESAEANIVQDAGDGVIREVNLAACRILARENYELVGTRLVEVMTPADRPRFAALQERVRLGAGSEPAIIEVMCLRPSGEGFPAQVTLRSATLESLPSLIACLRDVTLLKRAEAEKSQLELQMLHAQRLESLGVLAGGIAHDFNNILTAILGRLNLAALGLPPGPARTHLEEADFAVGRAAELCQQMLIYAGKGTPRIRALDLSTLVEEMGRMLEVAVAKHIELKRELAQQLPAIRGDSSQLRQVVMNLITNAADALGGSIGRIVLRTRELDVSGMLAERFVAGPPGGQRCVAVEVIDTGCGMDAETKRRMFDPFFTTKFTGRGLGMSAVLGIVRDHAGAISVESTLGRGTTVTVYFPVQPAGEPALPEAPAPRIRQRGLNVLLVDDDDAVRVLTANMIEHLGFSVTQAESGQQALAIFASERQRIQLAIVDVTMPDMDGLSVLTALRDQQDDLPIILASGYSQRDLAEWAKGRRNVSILTKPYDLATLAEAISSSQGEAAGR
jgi:PAS domain S-box-containing protein